MGKPKAGDRGTGGRCHVVYAISISGTHWDGERFVRVNVLSLDGSGRPLSGYTVVASIWDQERNRVVTDQEGKAALLLLVPAGGKSSLIREKADYTLRPFRVSLLSANGAVITTATLQDLRRTNVPRWMQSLSGMTQPQLSVGA